MTIIYRTAGPWGAGKGANLTAAEVDGNFHDLDTRLAEIETNPPAPSEIDSITSSGSALTITLSDGTVFGPLAIGSAALVFKGAWAASTAYKKNDIVTVSSFVYYVAVDHTSAATFDASRVISGTTVYQVMMDVSDATREAASWALNEGTHSGISFDSQPDGTVDATVDFGAGNEFYVDAVASSLMTLQGEGMSFFYNDASNAIYANVDAGWVGEVSLDALATALGRGTQSGITFTYDDEAAVGLGSLSATVSVSFTGLTQTPDSFAGEAGRLVRVRSDETGLEFVNRNEVVASASVPRFMGCMVSLASTLVGVNYSAGLMVPWSAEVYDTDGFHDNVTSNSRITIPAGLGIRKVRLTAVLRFANVTAGSDHAISIAKNGQGTHIGNPAQTQEVSGATTGGISVSSGPIPVVDGDYFEVNFLSTDTSIDLDSARCAFTLEVVEVEGSINIANVQTEATTARILGVADINDHLLCTNASPVAITVPANATVAIPIGAGLDIEQNGTGQVTVAAALGVTINKPPDKSLGTRTRYSVVSLRKVAINTWTLSGDMA